MAQLTSSKLERNTSVSVLIIIGITSSLKYSSVSQGLAGKTEKEKRRHHIDNHLYIYCNYESSPFLILTEQCIHT